MVKKRDRRRQHGGPPFREPYVGPPTVVSWEIDYGYGFPVINASPGIGFVATLDDDETLGLSPDLVQRLTDWADRWEVTAMREVRGHVDRDASAALDQDRLTLLYDLRRELDPAVELLVEGVPFDEWRERRR